MVENLGNLGKLGNLVFVLSLNSLNSLIPLLHIKELGGSLTTAAYPLCRKGSEIKTLLRSTANKLLTFPRVGQTMVEVGELRSNSRNMVNYGKFTC